MNYSAQVRICNIDKEIRCGRYPSIQSLARQLEVSERTIHRDLNSLRNDFGAPIQFDSEKDGYYYKESTWNLPAILFTEKELLALLIAKNAIACFAGDPYGEHLKSACEKLVKFLPEESTLNLGKMEGMYSFRFGRNRHVDPAILECIARGMNESRQLKIVYHTASRGDVTERVVEPCHLDNLHGDWYMVGFCQLRKAHRVFAVNRIQRCFVLDGTFKPDPDFCYEDYIRNAFGIMRTDKVVHVAVQFRGYEARLARERSLHESQRTEEMPDGSVIIHLDVTGLEEVKRWVLSCGKDAKVLEPDWFALELKNEIEEMQKRYI